MSSRRKLDTSLFRPKEDIDEEAFQRNSRDTQPDEKRVPDSGNPILKRASFDLREDQIFGLQELKIRLARQGDRVRLSDLAREAMDDLLEKYEQE